MKRLFFVFVCVLVVAGFGGMLYLYYSPSATLAANASQIEAEQKKFIKWVDFNVPTDVLKCAYDLGKKHDDFPVVKSLAYITSQNGNKFSSPRDKKRLYALYQKVNDGKNIDEVAEGNKWYKHYQEVYESIFAEFFDSAGKLKAYHPIAKGHWHNSSDDFGSSRSYGFKRKHLGHDIWGSVGTPIVAIEGGEVAEVGWNQYGGWRIGIRSHDTKRYYYYAHMRKNKPFPQEFKIGDKITAGQHIGYLGATGYSKKENVNMKTNPHLHLGLQLIFDKSQLDGNGEIWIDMFAITRLLSHNKATLPL